MCPGGRFRPVGRAFSSRRPAGSGPEAGRATNIVRKWRAASCGSLKGSIMNALPSDNLENEIRELIVSALKLEEVEPSSIDVGESLFEGGLGDRKSTRLNSSHLGIS